MKRIVVIETTSKKVTYIKNVSELSKLYPQLRVTQDALVVAEADLITSQDVIALLNEFSNASNEYYEVGDYKDILTSHNTANAKDNTTVQCTASIATDTPPTGIIRIVKSGVTKSYWYSSFTSDTFTLQTKTVTAAAGGSSTVLKISSGTFLDGTIKPGMLIRNVTDDSYATIVSIDSATQLTTTALSGGSDGTFSTSDSVEINVLVAAIDNTYSVYTSSEEVISKGIALNVTDAYGDEISTLNEIPKDTTQSSYLLLKSGSTYTRYRYTKAIGKKITIDTLKLTAGVGGDGTTLIGTGFTAGARVGDIVYNVTDGSHATIVTVDSNTQITTTALTGGTHNLFTAGNTVWVHVVGTAIEYNNGERAIMSPWYKTQTGLIIVTIQD
jgi:hypothetical protein